MQGRIGTQMMRVPSRLNQEALMPFMNILILTGIILAFAIFAAALAWGEYQTRHLGHGAQSGDAIDNAPDLKKAA
jgi:hypothetical protein